MGSWAQIRSQVPELAASVEERLRAHRHLTMATLRRDGAPRVSGTELVVHGEHLWLAGMVGARRFDDLRRDPRVALHSGSDDPPTWTGDAKVAGRALEVTDPDVVAEVHGGLGEAPPGPFELFRLDLTELVLVRLGEPADHIVIESWTEGAEVVRSVRR